STSRGPRSSSSRRSTRSTAEAPAGRRCTIWSERRPRPRPVVPKERDDPVLAGAVLAGAPLPLRPVLLAVHKPSLLEQQLHRRLGCCVRLGPADGPVAAPPPAVPVHRLAHRTHLDRPNQHEEVARACCACSLRRGTRSRGGRMAVPPEV